MGFDVGALLQGMGPGLLSGIGKAIDSSPAPNAPHPPDPSHPSTAKPNSFKTGGVVQKTGVALVHKGEKVIPVSEEKSKHETVHLSSHRIVMHLHKGGLHRALNVPEDQDIPKEKVEAATHSKNPHVRAMANLAHTMSGWKK